MRSRFDAYQRHDRDWLLATWHPSTRPRALQLDADVEWRKLQVVDVVRGGADDDEGIVEFRASYRSPDHAGVLHERSRFVRVDGRWVYVDGEHPEE